MKVTPKVIVVAIALLALVAGDADTNTPLFLSESPQVRDETAFDSSQILTSTTTDNQTSTNTTSVGDSTNSTTTQNSTSTATNTSTTTNSTNTTSTTTNSTGTGTSNGTSENSTQANTQQQTTQQNTTSNTSNTTQSISQVNKNTVLGSDSSTCTRKDYDKIDDASQPLLFNKTYRVDEAALMEFVVQPWYRVVRINADLEYAQSLLITDVRITGTKRNDPTQYQKCEKSARLCIYVDARNQPQSEHLVSLCMQMFYVYVYTNQSASCNNIEAIIYGNDFVCNAVRITPEIECAMFNKETCSNKDINKCDRNCFWANCIVERDGKNSTVGGFCLPVKMNSELNIDGQCRQYDDYLEGRIDDQEDETNSVATYTQALYCGDVDPYDLYNLAQKKTGLSGLALLGIFIGFIVFLFLCCVCFYRGFTKIYGYRPFEPPEVCPHIFFPREVRIVPESVAQELSEHRSSHGRGSYEPPKNV